MKWFIVVKRWWQRVTRKEDQQRTVNDNHLPDNLPHPARDGDDYRVWIKDAENVHETEDFKMRSRGEYRYGYPEGIVVHYTAGWHLKKGTHINPFPVINTNRGLEKMSREYALRTCRGGVKNGYNFLVMDVLGKVYQSRPLTKWGYHAGKSYWKGLGYSVSKRLTGVEILNPSHLKIKDGKFVTWFKYIIPSNLVRRTSDGYFQHYSREQEDALLKLCVWLYKNSPVIDGEKVFKIKNIVGHNEVAPKRKSDPCGALSVSMDKFREMVKEAVK